MDLNLLNTAIYWYVGDPADLQFRDWGLDNRLLARTFFFSKWCCGRAPFGGFKTYIKRCAPLPKAHTPREHTQSTPIQSGPFPQRAQHIDTAYFACGRAIPSRPDCLLEGRQDVCRTFHVEKQAEVRLRVGVL
ncbi:unnamed protein product [Pylaiella littoralis]